MHKRIKLLSSILLCLLLCACADQAPVVKSGMYFDTPVRISVYGDDSIYLDDCIDICKEAELLYSAHNPDSLLYDLDHRGSRDHSPLIPLINEALYYSDLTKGAADPAIGAAAFLWDFKSEAPTLPDDGALKEALKHIDPDTIIINGDDITITDPDTQIDLGFIAKGYISALIRDHLSEKGVSSALINLGGNIVVIGTKPDGREYKIGIQYPFGNGSIVEFNIRDKAVVTSGIYERRFNYENHFYHHILDPKTAYPVDNDLLSVTIVSSDPVKADALSTACMVMGREKGLEFIENTGDAEALFIDKHYDIYTSSDFPVYEFSD